MGRSTGALGSWRCLFTAQGLSLVMLIGGAVFTATGGRKQYIHQLLTSEGRAQKEGRAVTEIWGSSYCRFAQLRHMRFVVMSLGSVGMILAVPGTCPRSKGSLS
jgi:hypothetical protein